MLGGFKPIGYHAVNVALHCLATFLVIQLARRLHPNGAGVAGLVFASHPIHTEAVAGIVGRADLIACNFYLLAFLSYVKHVDWRESGASMMRQWTALGATLLSSSVAVLCKETAVTALVICAIYDIIKGFTGYRDKVKLSILYGFFFFPQFWILGTNFFVYIGDIWLFCVRKGHFSALNVSRHFVCYSRTHEIEHWRWLTRHHI